ncbi:MAG: hypothetical protein WCY01_03610 [Alkalispirochaeta sp.]
MITPLRLSLTTVFFAALLIQCTSTDQPPQQVPQHIPQQSAAPPISDGRDSRDDRDSLMQDLSPRDGQAVFLGVSARLRNRDAEQEAAVLHVAEQASRFVRFYAEYRYITKTTTGGTGYLDDIIGRWDAEYADSLVESVEVMRTVQDHEGTYVYARVHGIPAPPDVPRLEPAPPNKPPRWISSPPVVSGYITAVGISTPSHRIRDSLDRADQDALKEILFKAGTTVRMIEEIRDRDRRGTTHSVVTSQEASATLRNFYVLARYISPDGRYYYSLAVAREE